MMIVAIIVLCMPGCSAKGNGKNNTYAVATTGKKANELGNIKNEPDKEALTYRIVDTGQKKFYSDKNILNSIKDGQDFYGQDGNYAGFQTSYTDNGDGTVTDNLKFPN